MISLVEDDNERRGKCGRGKDRLWKWKWKWWCSCDVTLFLCGCPIQPLYFLVPKKNPLFF